MPGYAVFCTQGLPVILRNGSSFSIRFLNKDSSSASAHDHLDIYVALFLFFIVSIFGCHWFIHLIHLLVLKIVLLHSTGITPKRGKSANV